MARIRTIKPDFFQSEDVAALTYRARLTWIGLWTYVDDAGRCKDNPRLIKGHVWPLEDDVTAAEVEVDLAQLADGGRITRYEVDGEPLIQVVKWSSHQRISKPSPSKLPEPSATIPVALPESSGSPTSGKGKERKGKEEEEERSEPAPTPHPIPESFTLTPERRQWAKDNTPAVNVELETGGFIDYWRGTQGRKKDWETTWRNWLRRKQGDAETRGWKPQAQKDIYNPANW